MRNLSPYAIAAINAHESDDPFVALLTITSGMETVRLANNWTHRLSETADQITYGLVSRGDDFMFMPFDIVFPTDEEESASLFSVTIRDLTRELTPVIRSLSESPNVLLEVVLRSDVDTVEAIFPDFKMGAISYSQGLVSAQISKESDASEPFPCYTFTPSVAPGLF